MMGGALIFPSFTYMYMLILLASFFLPSHLSFKNMYYHKCYKSKGGVSQGDICINVLKLQFYFYKQHTGL